MRKFIAITTLLVCNFGLAQVIIGDAVGTATTKTSVLLEFSKAENRGIIIPYVTTIPSSPAEGTIVLDATVTTDSRVKYYNGSWIYLSGIVADTSNVLPLQNTATEATAAKTIIGASSSSADGVLVLESTTQAMVLPQVSDVALISSPSPGMMVYINKAGAKRLAVYNGFKWSFWKP